MGKVSNHNSWRKTINEFYACNDNIKLSDFCKEKNITKSQFHYFKKKLGINKGTIIFHSVSLNEDKNIIENNEISAANEVTITIGDARISIPSCEVLLISSVIKELIAKC
ncbi:hypothetical protein B0H39_005030 [Clostridium beijerinckii]|uniref:hypothetical protein n=1 Tax=Clostridium beijerinckii TaxID=1520 RepID=UPI001494821D|nr:hypothetical protein [Clostridium beijerinckii]NOW82519.1 hypothetical protein [Clostridium beijerinckii]NOW82703.1 hypothetical protein [Clostridium beijerinckii]NOW82927.1 hypothetical protein [Clostridium beijerinckii]NOW83034.1 hypothetical protein [Clostridium beijerinckii]NOW83152.1 hypothetical protein [Clostridium beijerinckii]